MSTTPQTPQNKQSSNKSPEVEIQFQSENIGRWASRQENPFAQQNRRAQAKRQQSDETRRKATPFVAIAAGIFAIGIAVFGLAVLIINLTKQPEVETPTITGGTMDDVISFRDILQEFYSSKENANKEDVTQIVDDVLATDDGQQYASQVKLAESMFYLDNKMYTDAVDVANQIDPSQLTETIQEWQYYTVLYTAYARLGNREKVEEYFGKVANLSSELNMGGGA